MKILLNVILSFISIVSIPTLLHAQSFSFDSTTKTVDVAGFNNEEIHLTAVKKQPDYPGGKTAWKNFLRSNIDLSIPFANKAVPGTYKVIIRYIVVSDGKLLDIGADTNCGYGMESEVIRCIKKSILWIPAETSTGKKVRFTLRTVVLFTVKHNDIAISFP